MPKSALCQSRLLAHIGPIEVPALPETIPAYRCKGMLIERRLAEPGQAPHRCAARRAHAGAALKWFLARLEQPELRRTLTGLLAAGGMARYK
jgi:hypothetical protein